MGYIAVQTVVEISSFIRSAQRLLTEQEHADLIVYLASHPNAGDEIVGTGGVRKVRFAARSKGKSGGVRVVCYFYDLSVPLYALHVYGKNEREDLTADERRAAAAFAAAIKAAIRAERRGK